MNRIKMDSRGHEKIRKMLYDIGDDTLLDVGDVAMSNDEGVSLLVEIKEVGDLLHSISSGRLYEQTRAMSADYPMLIVYPVIAPNDKGVLRISSRWKYSSVQGILLDLCLKGVPVVNVSSEYAVGLTIRSLYNQLSGKKKSDIRFPKIFQFRAKESNSLKVLCAFPGINITTAERLLTRFHTLKRICNTTEEELQDCPWLTSRQIRSIGEVVGEWSY